MSDIVLIDGATGYLGSHLASQLLLEGRPVRCLVRKESSPDDIKILEQIGAEVRFGDIASGDVADSIYKDVGYAVHLIGSIAPRRGESLLALHQVITRQFAEQARRAGVEKLVMVTALGSDKGAASEYHRTKWMAEEEVRSSGIAFTILRPSLLIGKLVGRRDSKLVRRLIGFIESKPFVPLINGGVNKIQPLFIKDMVEVISRCLSSSYNGETIELGGSTVLSMRRFVEALEDILGKRKPIINLDPKAGKLLASAMEKLQEVPTLSKDQVILSMSDNICRANGLSRILGTDGSTLDDALGTYRVGN